MSLPTHPLDEEGRLAALRACQILDTSPESDFDDLAALAALVCDAPISLIAFVFTSGYSAEIAGRELTLQFGQNFIQKPSSPDQLLRTVRRSLDS